MGDSGADGVSVLRPSGNQIEITSGEHRACVTQVGATLRSYSVGRIPVLDGFSDTEMSAAGRGQVLAPWPNRLRDGKYSFKDATYQLPVNEIDKANAIHGLVRWEPWEITERDESSVRLDYTLFASPGYPWCIAISISYSLGEDGLTVAVSVTNCSDSPAPFGIGFHPYLTCGGEVIDSAVVTIPAKRTLEADARAIPVGSAPVMGTALDFRSGAPIGKVRLDTCFTDLERDENGVTTVTMSDPSTGRSVSVWAEEAFCCFMVYSGDTLPERQRRRQGLAVEPMTCVPNAFQDPAVLPVLGPGERLETRWGIHPGLLQ